MFNFIRTFRDARDNERRLFEIQDVLIEAGFVAEYDEEESDTLRRAIATLAETNAMAAEAIDSANARHFGAKLAAKTLGAALVEVVDLREQLIDAVDEALQVCRGVNSPNGTTKKLDRILTEALAAQPRGTAEETPVEADEDGIRDIEADNDEVPADEGAIADLEQDAAAA